MSSIRPAGWPTQVRSSRPGALYGLEPFEIHKHLEGSSEVDLCDRAHRIVWCGARVGVSFLSLSLLLILHQQNLLLSPTHVTNLHMNIQQLNLSPSIPVWNTPKEMPLTLGRQHCLQTFL